MEIKKINQITYSHLLRFTEEVFKLSNDEMFRLFKDVMIDIDDDGYHEYYDWKVIEDTRLHEEVDHLDDYKFHPSDIVPSHLKNIGYNTEEEVGSYLVVLQVICNRHNLTDLVIVRS